MNIPIWIGIGLLISAISKSSAQALALVPTTLLPMVIFSGGMTPIKSMPDSGYIDAYRISMLMPTRLGSGGASKRV